MSRKRSSIIGWFGILLGAVLLISCGGGGGGSDSGGGTTPATPPVTPLTTLSGTAAAGAPIQGTVTLRDSAGTARTQTINTIGEFQFDLTGLTPPYLLWADGIAGGKEAFFYSMATEGGRANVTPATHCILAMALGKNPVSYYRENPDAAPPDAASIEAAKQKLSALFLKLFETTGVPAGFDLMTGQFSADGTGFDSIMDVLEMNADEESVNILDRGSNTALFKQELASGNVLVQETPEKVNELCMAGMDVLNAVKAIFKTLSDQFVTARPSYDALLAVMQPLMSDEFRHNGNDREGLILNLANNEPIGLKFENVAIYRKMKQHTIGTVAPTKIDELPAGYAEGVWCTYNYRTNRAQPRITAFVRETSGGPWKWHGNQNPFQNGGTVEPESAWWRRNQYSNGLQVLSGLRFRTWDSADSALSRYGIEKFAVLNSALPKFTDPSGNELNGIVLTRTSISNNFYNITSTGYTWTGRHFETDGLGIDAITNTEFVFFGLDSANNITHAWVGLLYKKPVQEAILWKDVIDRGATGEFSSYFSELLSIWGEASEVYMPPGSINPSSIPLEWELAPNGQYVEWAGVSWRYDPNNLANYYTTEASNPARTDPSLDWASWISTTLNISSANWPPIYGTSGYAYNYILTRDDFHRRYVTETDFKFADPPVQPIRIDGRDLYYQTFSDPSKNYFRGYADFSYLGLPIEENDIQDFKLLGPSGEVTDGTISFTRQFYYFKSSTDPNNLNWRRIYFSEYVMSFPVGKDLPPGDYRFQAVTWDGTVLTTPDINRGVAEVMPVVNAASMQSEWLPNGDLKLSWQYPDTTGFPTPTQQRIWIYCDAPGTKSEIFLGLNAAIPTATTVQEVIIPKRVIDSGKILSTVISPNWQVQLRYSPTPPAGYNSNQAARGVSDRVTIAGWK
jgi:hypothetical protein